MSLSDFWFRISDFVAAHLSNTASITFFTTAYAASGS
jgi:hypothetical protein